MKLEVGKAYRSNVAQQTLPGGDGFMWETWCVLSEIAGECFVAMHSRPGQTLYRVFGPDGVCLDDTGGGTTRKLLPNTVKKKGWIARQTSSFVENLMIVGRYVKATEEEAKMLYPGALSYHEIEWEEEE